MKHLTEHTAQLVRTRQDIEDAHKATFTDPSAMDRYIALQKRHTELNRLPADHDLKQWECPCGVKWHGDALIICYVTMYRRTADGKDEWILMTDRGEEHHMAFCPDCAAKVEPHHNKRDFSPKPLPPPPEPELEPEPTVELPPQVGETIVILPEAATEGD